jgi:hypothetical protein
MKDVAAIEIHAGSNSGHLIVADLEWEIFTVVNDHRDNQSAWLVRRTMAACILPGSHVREFGNAPWAAEILSRPEADQDTGLCQSLGELVWPYRPGFDFTRIQEDVSIPAKLFPEIVLEKRQEMIVNPLWPFFVASVAEEHVIAVCHL